MGHMGSAMPAIAGGARLCLLLLSVLLAGTALRAQLAITRQPDNAYVKPGEAAVFSVGVTATPTANYQWRVNGADIAGATDASYRIAAAWQFDNGFYDVCITSGSTSAISQTARLLVTPPPYPSAQTVDLSKSIRLEGPKPKVGLGASIGHASLPDGRFYLIGEFSSINGTPHRNIARFLADGKLDTTFTPPDFDKEPSAIALQKDGKILLCGAFKSVGGVSSGGIVRLNPDGSRDASFASGSGFIYGASGPILLARDGSILVSSTPSDLHSYNGTSIPGYMAKLKSNGELDTGFTFPELKVNSSNTNPLGFALGPNDEIFVHGAFDTVGGFRRNNIVKLLLNGQVDASFDPGSGPNNYVYAMQVLSSGKLIVGGLFTSYNGSTVGHIARIDAKGALDTTFASGSGFSDQIQVLAELPGGAVFVGTTPCTYKGEAVGFGVRLNGDGSLDKTFSYNLGGRPDFLNVLPGNRLLVSGNNISPQGSPGLRILEWNGMPAQATTPILRFFASASVLAPLPDGKVFVAGDFDYANGIQVPYVLRLNADLSIDGSFINKTGATTSVMKALVQKDGKIVLSTWAGLVKLNADGSMDDGFTRNAGGLITGGTFQLNNGNLLVPVGVSDWRGTRVTNGLVILDKEGKRVQPPDFSPGPSSGSYINGFQQLPSGKFLVIGSFNSWNGVACSNAVRLNADGSVDSGFSGADIAAGNTSGTGSFFFSKTSSLQRSGNILLTQYPTSRPQLARFYPDGRRDGTFARVMTDLMAMGSGLVQADDRLLVSTQRLSSSDFNVVTEHRRLEPDGTIDASFSVSGSEYWLSLMIADNGELLTSDGYGYLHRYRPLQGPVIKQQPASQSVVAGATVLLSVGTNGEGTLSFQWSKNGVPLAGATNQTLQIDNVRTDSAGAYSVSVRDAVGVVNSNTATLTVTARPGYGTAFGSLQSNAGSVAMYIREDDTFVFIAYIANRRTVYYHRDGRLGPGRSFRFNASSLLTASTDAAVEGAILEDGTIAGTLSGMSFTLQPPAQSGNTSGLAGSYQLGQSAGSGSGYLLVDANGKAFAAVVTANACDAGPISVGAGGGFSGPLIGGTGVSGAIQAGTSTVTFSTIEGSSPPMQLSGSDTARRSEIEALTNLSSRSLIDAANPSFTVGFVVTGNRPKDVLIRGIGPALAGFGVVGSLSAAHLEIYRGSTRLATGDDWGSGQNTAAIVTASKRLGAFELAANSRDAALLLSLEPGSYSAIVSGQANATGVCLVEVYDATQGSIAKELHLANLSALGNAGTGDNVLAAGFAVSGLVPKRVLIRGVGPALRQYGVSNALADPDLRLFAGTRQIAQNIGWSASPEKRAIAAASSQVSAFALPDAAADSALLLYLAPGLYTVQVSGKDGLTGRALIEIYEVP